MSAQTSALRLKFLHAAVRNPFAIGLALGSVADRLFVVGPKVRLSARRVVALWALLWAGLLLLRRRLAKVRTVCAVEGRVGGPVSAIRRFLASPLRQYWPTPWLVSGPVQSAASELLLPRPSDESLIDLERVQFDMEAIARPAHVTCCPVRVPEGVVSIDWVTLRRQNARQDARQKKRETKAEMGTDAKAKAVKETETGATANQDTSMAPVVIIVPGLTGDSGAGYTQRMAAGILGTPALTASKVCIYSPRGRGENPMLSPFLYSAGYTQVRQGDTRFLPCSCTLGVVCVVCVCVCVL
jgi:hypothetical protein